MYRGDAARTGRSDAEALGNWSPSWTFDTGAPVDASPAVAYGLVYVGSSNGIFYALDAQTGHLAWSFAAPGYYFQPSAAVDEDGVYTLTRSPAVDSSGNYVWDENGTLRGHDRLTGSVLWARDFDGDMFASPAVVSGHLIVAAGKRIVSVATTSGTIEWSFPTEDAHYSSPAICKGVVVAATLGGDVHALSVKDGTLLWHRAFEARFDASPSCQGDRVFISTGPGDVLAISLMEGADLWSYRSREPIESSAALDESNVYLGTNRQTFLALSQQYGRVSWTTKIAGVGLSSPTLIGNELLIRTFPGDIYAISRTDGKSRIVFSAQEAVQASVAFAGDTAYFSSRDGKVYAWSNDLVSVIGDSSGNGKRNAPNILGGGLLVGLAVAAALGRSVLSRAR